MRSGLISRSFIIGISVCPPAMTFAPSPALIKAADASTKLPDFEVVEISMDTSSYSAGHMRQLFWMG